ncbi:hypothetical protein [Algibacter sp. L1A34]|uniref:hypothetical protein n=1 Tax=Algibacter sp. L1A34 TaxID=2686365 RepID=UPI00131CA237|nr:hypothetical protein [Algibacter sp. L1A34]
MKKEFIIKKTPLLKIVLNKMDFEIINHQYKEENGVFLYSKLYDIGFKEKSTNHLETLFVFFFSLILPGATSKIMKTKERIRMNYDGKEKHFILFDFDKHVVLEVITEIKKRIN